MVADDSDEAFKRREMGGPLHVRFRAWSGKGFGTPDDLDRGRPCDHLRIDSRLRHADDRGMGGDVGEADDGDPRFACAGRQQSQQHGEARVDATPPRAVNRERW